MSAATAARAYLAVEWRSLARLSFAALPLLAALGPIASISGGIYGFRIALIAIVGLAVLVLLGRGPWPAPDIWLALATVSIVVTGLVGLPRIAVGSSNPYSEYLTLCVGLCAALATRAWQRRVPGLFLALSRGWVVAGIVTCAIALVEVITGRHLPGYVTDAAPDPAATFGNPNSMAVFLVMSVVWVTPVHSAGSAVWRAATWLLVLGSAPMIYLANARLSLLVWALVVVVVVWGGLRRSRHRLAGLALAASPLLVVVALLGVIPVLADYSGEIATPGSSGGVREQLTRQGLAFAFEHGGLPTWPGSFEALMRAEGDLQGSGGLVNAHNIWVEVLVQYGIVSLVLVLGWLCACAVAGKSMTGGLLTPVVVFLALGVVDSSSLDSPSTWAFVLTLAVASRTALIVRLDHRVDSS